MIKNIVSGIKAYFGAFSLISKLNLWKYFAIPMLISFITAIVIGVSAYGLSDNIVDYITSIYPSWNTYDWLKTTFRIITGLIIILLGLIIYKHIVMALSAPFMSPVSEKIEAHLLGSDKTYRITSFTEQLWRAIRINVRNLFMELLITIPLLILSFIPIIGILFTILIFFIQAYYAGFGNMDYTLERHYKYNESLNFVKRNRGLAIGNGIIFILFLLIPFIGVILVLPLSVTAASVKTIEALQLESHYEK
ncbi:EI24 domain-containing protein [Aestuariibaculum sp. YM273]|uniref:EI24 domain-containing protein n=1 Tax=Aestuariibaculum sp. YM273 TaxID=3070659 RepID=UPI0027DD95FB|nr:EI24 domain-containing protein [Aestuariibaculum sp. YM273]WMI66564.1 EI24 domain-containing protein [Aestuariibaculum sp. YM273]